jgi:hypothetical protein
LAGPTDKGPTDKGPTDKGPTDKGRLIRIKLIRDLKRRKSVSFHTLSFLDSLFNMIKKLDTNIIVISIIFMGLLIPVLAKGLVIE